MMKKKDDFMKKVIISMLIFLLIFTVTVLFLFYKTGGTEPSTLIAAVFAATVGEMGFCSFIKKAKLKDVEESEEISDDD